MIIERLVLAIMNNLPKILDAGAKIIRRLAGALITKIPCCWPNPQIVESLK